MTTTLLIHGTCGTGHIVREDGATYCTACSDSVPTVSEISRNLDMGETLLVLDGGVLAVES